MTEDRVNTATHCRYCRTELTYDEKRKCKVCLNCHPPSKNVIAPPEKKKGYIDVKVTEAMVREIIEEALANDFRFHTDRIREICRDELENWHIQKPPATKTEIRAATDLASATIGNLTQEPTTLTDIENKFIPKQTNWRQQAKELGIPLYHKKKEDVLAEIKSRMAGVQSG